jgi:hypothetical protein
MSTRLNKLDRKLNELKDAKVSIKVLQLVSFCRKPRRYQDIKDSLGLTPDSVNKTVSRYNRYLRKKVAHQHPAPQGSQPIEVYATEEGTALLSCFK